MRFFFVFFVIAHCSGQFVFPSSNEDSNSASSKNETCVPITQCPALMNLLRENRKGIDEFESCGFDDDDPRNEPLYVCPEKLGVSECRCRDLVACKPLFDLVKAKKFAELKKHKECGFANRAPRYCCPKGPKRALSDGTDDRVNTLGVRQGGAGDDDVRLEESPQDMNVTMMEEDPNAACGFQPAIRVFGGADSTAHEWPWAVAIAYVNPDTNTRLYLCGGTLIGREHVITAAHCISSRSGHGIAKVRLGHADLESTEGGFDVDIEGIVIHEDYQTDPFLVNDIALLKLKEKVPMTNEVRPICLPAEDVPVLDEDIIEPTVIGWGLINATTSATILQKVELNVTSRAECDALYKEKVSRFNLVESQLCASGSDGRDSCKGDSGGPLMRLLDSSQWQLVGVTSFGTVRCDSSVPGVYTRVTSFVQWIRENMETTF